MRWIRVFGALLAALCLLAGGAAAEKQITLTFVGDCTLGSEERLMGKDYSFAQAVERVGYAGFLSAVEPLFRSDDLTVANFEGVLKDNAYGKANKTYCFRGLPAYAQILSLGSIDAVSLSNNHTGDFGNAGRKSTRSALENAGVSWFDATDAFYYERDGMTVAFCGFWRAGYYARREEYVQLIQSLRQKGADVVVCMLHFGQEYSPLHSEEQTEMARTMIDAGADLVIGHHPHVVQGVEVYRNRTICYSLGNFLFGGNAAVRANECLIPRVTLTFDDSGEYLSQQVRLYPGNSSGNAEVNDYHPRLVENDAAKAVFALVDQDGGQKPEIAAQTDAYRDYAALPAERTAVAP